MGKSRQRDGFFLFWSEWPSNWTQSPFELGGKTYNCVEQYMMAEKARLFGDTQAEARIMATADPADQKRYGKQVTPYNDDKWAAVRYNVVLQANLAKFRQNAGLREKLLATGDLSFIEASPYDCVWGIGLDADHPDATKPEKWKGSNLLGKVLDETRAILLAKPV